MTINSPLIEKILKIQNIENIDNNKLLILTLSIATAKTTGFKQIKEHVFPEKEFENLIDILNTNSILTKVDISLLDKLKKTKVKKIENFDIEIEEIIKHIGLLTNTKSRVTDNKKKLIERWLKKDYKVEDFKLVNSYFVHIWNNPEMESYIRETTLYNTKFPERVEEAQKAIDKFNKYENDLYDICKLFEAYFTEYVLNNAKENINIALISENTTYCKYLSFTAKKRISFWLDKGFKKEELIKTMIITIAAWSKKEDLREFISLEKIFDEKFENRFKVAEIKEIPFVKEKKSTNILKEWYMENNEDDIKQLSLDKNNIEEEENYIDAEVSEDSFMKNMFNKMKIW